MALVARILGVSMVTSALGAGLGLVLLGRAPFNEYIIPCILLGSVGGIIGAIAGTAREITAAVRQKDIRFSDMDN